MDAQEQKDRALALILQKEEDERMSRKRSQFKGFKGDGQHVHPPNGSSSCQRSPVKPTVFDLQRNTREAKSSKDRQGCRYLVGRDDRLRPVERGRTDDTAQNRIDWSAVSSNVDEQSLRIGVAKVNVPKDANLIRKDDPHELRDKKEHMDMALALALSLQEHQKAQSSGQQRDRQLGTIMASIDDSEMVARDLQDEVYKESLAARNDAVHHIITGANASPPLFQQDEAAAFPNPDDDLTYEQMVEMPDVSRGLSKKARAQLPTETYKRNAKNKSEECPICMEKYIDGVLLTTLPCFHSYHSKCINAWLKNHADCPECRLEIKIKSY